MAESGSDTSAIVDRHATPDERAAILELTDAYGYVVKTDVDQLAQAIGADEQLTDALLAKVSEALPGIAFPERAELHEHLQAAARILGFGAVKSAAADTPLSVVSTPDAITETDSVSQPRQQLDQEQVDQQQLGEDPTETGSHQPDATAADQTDIVGNEDATPEEEVKMESKLRTRYITMLSKVFDDDQLERIPDKNLPALLETLFEHYLSLRIPGVTAQGKLDRCSQIRQHVVDGLSFKELSKQYGVSHSVVSAGVTTAIRGIAKRTDKEALDIIIHTALSKPVEGAIAETTQGPTLAAAETAKDEIDERIETFIALVIPERNPEERLPLLALVAAGPKRALDVITQFYTSIDSQMSQSIREEDVTLLRRYIYDNVSLTVIAGELGLEEGVIQRRVDRVVLTLTHNFGVQAVTDRIEGYNSSDNGIVSLDALAADPAEATEPEVEQELSYDEIIEQLTAAMGITTKLEADTVKQIFSPTMQQTLKGGLIKDTRAKFTQALQVANSLAKEPVEKLTEGEIRFLSDLTDTRDAIPVRSAQNKRRNEIQASSLSPEEFTKNAILKFTRLLSA